MHEAIGLAFLLFQLFLLGLSTAFFLPRAVQHLTKWKTTQKPENLTKGIVCGLATFFLFSSFIIFILHSLAKI